MAGLFAADEEVGRDLAAVDWAATPLGLPGSWPQSLQTAVDILLSSRFSMWMAWGPQLTFFCNAAYRRDTLGRKYPWALGRPASEVWAEIWDDIGPRIDTVLATGKATWDEALLLFLERSGYPEETYHTFSYSPLRDDAGAVVGMLCVVSEDTERVIGERRMATLRDLGSDPSVVRTEQETLDFAGRQLDRNRQDLPFTLTYLFGDDGAAARLAGSTGIAPGTRPPRPRSRPATRTRCGQSRRCCGANPRWWSLDSARFAGLPAGAWSEPPVQALVAPLARQGGAPYGFLVAALNRYRPLDEGYRAFVDLVAGHLAAGIASARSYQDQQRRAEELAELDRAKTTFFSNISHEFRTPLTLIMGPVQELRRRLADADPQVREELEVISRNGLRLGKLVNTLLDFSRIEAGRMQASYEPADLAQVTAELASVFRSAVDRAGLAFEVDCPPLPEPVYLDRGMWEKVVLNLLSNALKFTFDGSIRIAVRAEGGQAVVTVADTGIGVPAQRDAAAVRAVPPHREHPLPLERGQRHRPGPGPGTRPAARRHHHRVQHRGRGHHVHHPPAFRARPPARRRPRPRRPRGDGLGHAPTRSSRRPCAGCPGPRRTATARAARPVHEEITPGNDADPSAQAGRALPARVLVADDNADMREYLARLLRTAGYQVTTVTDGQAALDAVRAGAPDLVISDVMMPRLDGLGLVAALRADARTAAVPVLLLSARAGQEASIEGLRAGADDYLVKPFSAAELLARVAVQRGAGQVQEPRIAVPPHLDRLPPGRLLRHRSGRHHPGGQSGLPGPGGLRPGRLAVPLAAPLGSRPRRRP